MYHTDQTNLYTYKRMYPRDPSLYHHQLFSGVFLTLYPPKWGRRDAWLGTFVFIIISGWE
jgi:hypothetical protein